MRERVLVEDGDGMAGPQGRGGDRGADAARTDDEDNLLICQVAKEKYLCERIIARVNNPRNLEHFKLLGIQRADLVVAVTGDD